MNVIPDARERSNKALTRRALRTQSGRRKLLSVSLIMSPIRDPIRAFVKTVVPDDIVWLDAADLAHPEASRATTLPFVFEIGRLTIDGRAKTVRELDLVAAAMPEGERIADSFLFLLDGYARFVVATNPTRHARLTGRVLTSYITTFLRIDR